MTSIQSAQDSLNPSRSDSAGSPSAAGIAPALAVSTAKSSARSYANAATKKTLTPTSAVSTSVTSPVDGTQHGNQSLTNGNMAAPTIVNSTSAVNGASGLSDLTRKPSVTISAAGASGYIPNGGLAAPSARPNISFGSLNAGGSPAISNSAPYQSQNSLHTPQNNPRITSPGRSPSPIPQPTASGGRPPTAYQAQGNGPIFGSMGGGDGDVNRQMQGATPVSAVPGPVHLRRQSSQSAHGDMNAPNMSFPPGPNRGGFMPGGGRGRVPSFNHGFTQQAPFSPSQNFRPLSNQRPGTNMPPHFQNQAQLAPHPNSPHLQPRSPGHQGSHPGTPQMQHMQMNPNQMQFQPAYGAYSQHLTPQSGHFGIQQPYDPAYGYYSAGYQMHPQYMQQGLQQGPPASPRQFRQPPPSPYGQSPYNPSPPQNMSRSASQISEVRPPSTTVGLGQQQPPPPPAPTPASLPGQTPSQTASTAPPPNSNFTIPSRAKKGIVIKNADGEIVTFDKKVSPVPAPVPSPSPASVAPVPTPPPRSASTTSRTPPESKTGKTAAEIKAEFLEQVKKGSQEDRSKDEEDALEAKARLDSEAKALGEKEKSDAQAALEKQQADEKAALEKQEAEDRAAKEREDAEQKAVADKEAAKKLETEKVAAEKAAAEKEAAEKAIAEKAAAEKAAADKAAADKAAADKAAAEEAAAVKAAAEKAAAEKAAADKAESDKLEAERVETERVETEKAQTERIEAERAASEKEASDKEGSEKASADAEKANTEIAQAETVTAMSDKDDEKRLQDEEMERMIAEMEAADREEEERQKAYEEKKKKLAAEKAAREADTDENLKRQEREAEAAEAAREQQNPQEEDSEEVKAEKEKLFASLKKPTLGPGAEAEDEHEPETTIESETPEAGLEESKYASPTPRPATSSKPKPAALKLDTAKPIEPAQPTPGMQALKSARMLQLQSESVSYPEGIKSPNPALIQGGKRAGRLYDKDFLMQFREAFKEKPSVDWDTKLKESVGDGSDTGGAKSARTPAGMTPRATSARAPPPSAYQGMGTFGQAGGRTLPPHTTSQARFDASNRPPTMSNPLAGFAGRPGAFPMGNVPPPQARQPSMGAMHGPGRTGTNPRRGTSRRDDPRGGSSRKEQEKANSSMPLTAGADLKPLELSGSGWKPPSLGRPSAATSVDLSGHMAPDMVQRKVKAALNKMTPERFDKIADQILEIAAQSKNEADGRTLRQIIQLTFDKACDEAHWASMYAKFCLRMLEQMSPEIKDETIRDKNDSPVVGGPLFRKYLLNRCQEEFERGWVVNLPGKKEGESDEAAMLSDEYYIAAAAKRKGLGLVQFIGELYKLRMLSIKIMHECFRRLLDFEGMPDETAIESLVKLLRTVGLTMSQAEQGPSLLDQYFQRIDTIMKMEGLPSRMHFMLLDTCDLRRAGWHSKDDAKGPKTIQEIRDEAAVALQQAELARQQQNQRGGGGRPPAGRGDARNFSGPMAPPDYPRNQVATDDLRRLGNRRQASSQGPARTLGPSSMFSSRSNSGKPSALGPPGGSPMTRGDDSGGSSRTASRKDDKKEEVPQSAVNAFSALENLDGEAGELSPTHSPALKNAQPAVTDAESGNDNNAPASTSEGASASNEDAVGSS